jgi:fatty acid desaturase
MTRWKGTALHDVLGAWTFVWSYAPIAAALAVFARWPSVWTFALAFALTAFRQNALFVVAHESFHNTLFRSRPLNEVLGGWLAARPILLPYAQSRHSHWEHHRHVGTAEDPDRYAWAWERDRRGAWLGHYTLTLLALPFVARAARAVLGIVRGRAAAPAEDQGRQGLAVDSGAKMEILRLGVTHLVILGVYAVTVGPVAYFTLWLLPAITLRVVIDDLRQFLEHREGRICIYRAGPVERFLLGPFNFHLHGFHHAVASEPWFCLPAIEERAREKLPDIVVLRSYTREIARFAAGRPLVPAGVSGGEAAPASSTTAASPR